MKCHATQNYSSGKRGTAQHESASIQVHVSFCMPHPHISTYTALEKRTNHIQYEVDCS